MQRVTYEFRAVRQGERRSEIPDTLLDDFVLLNARPKTTRGVGVRRGQWGLIQPCLYSHRTTLDASSEDACGGIRPPA